MIAPLPSQPGLPQPGLPQSGDPAAANGGPRGEGDGFAEILAAAAIAAPAPRIPGPPPTLDHGPAVVPVSDIELATPAVPVEAAALVQAEAEVPVQAGLTDPAARSEAPHPNQPRPAARIFNQDGFFGASVDAPPVDPGAAPALTSSIAAPAPVVSTSATPAADLPPSEAGAAAASPAAAPPAAVPAATPPHLSRVRPSPLATLATARPVAFEAETEGEPVKPLARRAPVREPAARTTVQVAMRELEQGVHVAARAEGLDAAERVRLHDEIAALLARHGLAARSIRISARLREWPSQERLK